MLHVPPSQAAHDGHPCEAGMHRVKVKESHGEVGKVAFLGVVPGHLLDQLLSPSFLGPVVF